MDSPLGDANTTLILLALVFLSSIVADVSCSSDDPSLSAFFYDYTCPQLQDIVRSDVEKAFKREARIAASLLRLHFHDCFINGCDASVLLDDTKTFKGEKSALPNANSLRGFELIDAIKARVEIQCEGVVSCADILTLAARDSVALTGGPSWEVLLGRRDSLTANRTAANVLIPPPIADVPKLVSMFATMGLTEVDMVTLSGAHSIGQARCSTFRQRLFDDRGSGSPDPTMQKQFLGSLQEICPRQGNGNAVAPLDFVTPMRFDNNYYLNLQYGKGIFASDQVLFSGRGITENYVRYYSYDQDAFFQSFVRSMIKMGNITPLTGKRGQIRKNCRRPN
ncbi:peroxidase A2-like [Selaginella moellendorffii]|uniref:peroxidase A2-like n=1 Tax=Selaginella moellendorffii TaxID=88036 RepID=UPI000D1CB17C|nr:peroxidase A2-like [Selaginella moellendorffii]XP_024537989.1 peroxidase A2-like [Selaginella moellendorffii]|eukprot:XP_024525726.1 peroxidase A2-like [Selaginella moellendorffii]